MKTTNFFRFAIICTGISSAAQSAPIPYRRSLGPASGTSFPTVNLEARGPNAPSEDHTENLEVPVPDIDGSLTRLPPPAVPSASPQKHPPFPLEQAAKVKGKERVLFL